MARRLPPRHKSGPKKGQFKKRAGSRRKNPPARKAAPRRRSTARKAPARRSYRRNPRRPDLVQMVTRGVVSATQVLAGKAAARAIPDLANLPKGGNAGLAVQVAVALAVGYIGEMVFSKTTAATMMAGALTAPVETVLVTANIPFVSQYLSPTAEANAVAGYVQRKPIAGYVQPPGLGSHGGDYGGAAGQDYPEMWT